MDIIELPPEEAPKQLTVRQACETLGEHYLAFLAANNLSGYGDDGDYILDPNKVADSLLLLATKSGISKKQVAAEAFRITRMTGKVIKYSAALELIARSLGYAGYQLMMLCRDSDDWITNVWRTSKTTVVTLNGEKKLKNHEFKHVNSNHDINVLFGRNADENFRKNAERNKERARVLKARKAREERQRLWREQNDKETE